MFVFTHSKGLYSEVSTIFIAAACITTSTFIMAILNRSLSLTSPIKNLNFPSGSLIFSRISYCFCSSREKITIRLIFGYLISFLVISFPKVPVPPVTKKEL